MGRSGGVTPGAAKGCATAPPNVRDCRSVRFRPSRQVSGRDPMSGSGALPPT